jgi:hypothetical protein
MSMIKKIVLALTTVAAPQSLAATLPAEYGQQASRIDLKGSWDANANGQLPNRRGIKELQVFLGTAPRDGAGVVTLSFERPFADGLGRDFALVTGVENFGPLAGKVLVQFFLGEQLQIAIPRFVQADRVFHFELPGTDVVANRVVISNITADPVGFNDDAVISIVDAGAAHTIVTSGD